MADYRTEDKSKYEICSVIGWPFETGAALARPRILRHNGQITQT